MSEMKVNCKLTTNQQNENHKNTKMKYNSQETFNRDTKDTKQRKIIYKHIKTTFKMNSIRYI